MKKIILAVFVLAAIFSSCKVFEKKGKKQAEVAPAATEAPAAQPKIFSAEPAKPAVRENPTSDQMYAKPETTQAEPVADSRPISMRSENFTFAQSEDQASNSNKNFFVIVGSFASFENATKLKNQLGAQGFKPVILKSESGNFRVCSNSFTDEMDARRKISEIRQKYANFSDCWLLKK